MKSTRTGHKWAHVSCALWIPEVSIGDVEKMEPITKISCIPVSKTQNISKRTKNIYDRIPMSAVPLVAGVRAVQGEERVVHPVQRQDLQDRLPRHLRLQTQPRDESHHRGRAGRGRGQAEGEWARYFVLSNIFLHVCNYF